MNDIISLTIKILGEWSNAYGYAPDSAANKLSKIMTSWINQLTECLKIWLEKAPELNDGELILAKTNLGCLVEFWLKFYSCIFYEDYLNNPIINKKYKKIIQPNEMRFKDLQYYSRGVLWEKYDDWDNWVYKIRQHRNVIHAINKKDIGTGMDFIFDINTFHDFITLIYENLPDPPNI